MDIKLIAIDMDGTLLNSSNKLTERTKKAIAMAKEKNVEVVLATGRVLKSALHYANLLNLDSYIAACNGAILVDNKGNDIYRKPINKKKLEKIMEIGHDMSVYFHFYNEDTFFTRTYVKEIVDYYSSSNGKFTGQSIDVDIYKSIRDIAERVDLDVFKFLFIDNDLDKLIQLKKRLGSIEGISISKSWTNNLEVMEEGVSKGRSLEHLCRLMNISLNNTMAIGDNENDLSMLEIAGISVGMGNGAKSVLEKVYYVTEDNNHDGVAQAIEKFVL
ncbi:Cof-type HAD-IIB family hydrolase [Gudongella sp. DL1XJH-153]|uniref:Cof-type HAD-IIB family hydrolase n=1 Tax=Gudongella sp. DL1XJH-153 TaxID=3409804 RepID=UPI003BB5666E